MKATPLSLLIIEDIKDEPSTIVETLERQGYSITSESVKTKKALRHALETQSWDAVISDYELKRLDSTAALEIFREYDLDTPFIVVASDIDEQAAVEIMKAGAHDYVIKAYIERLAPALQRELRESEFRKERRLALIDLKASEERFRSIVENSYVGIIILNDNFQFTYSNNMFYEMIGYSPEEIIGADFRTFTDEETKELVADRYIRRQKGEDVPSRYEVRMIRKDGSLRDVELSVSLIQSGPDGIQTMVQILDITDRKRSENELISSAKNLENRAAQLQVAAEIAHETASSSEINELLNRAASLIQERFGYYIVCIFLSDETTGDATLRSASGENAGEMLDHGYHISDEYFGIINHVFQEGEAYITHDVASDPLYRETLLLENTRSEISLPIKTSDKTIGVLDAQSEKANAFDENDMQTLQIIVNQLAVAIENMSLLNETQRRAQEFSSLYDTAVTTSSILETDDLLKRLYSQVQDLIEPDAFGIAFYVEDIDEIEIALAMESGKELKELIGYRFPRTEGGLTSWIIDNQEPLLIRDMETENVPAKPQQRGKDILSWLGVPLIARERLLGVASIQSFRKDAFDENHKQFLEAMASQIAISLENARLFSSEKARRQEAETLREVTGAISSSLNLDKVLQNILEKLQKVVPYNSCSIQLTEVDQLVVRAIGGDAHNAAIGYAFNIKDDSLVRPSILDGKSQYYGNVTEQDGWIQVPGLGVVNSWICVPLNARGQRIGILTVDHEEMDRYTESDTSSVLAFANQAAIAIENARLFDAERKQLTLAKSLQDVGMLLTSQLGLQEVLEKILDILGNVVQYDSASIQLIEGENRLYLAAGRGFTDIEKAKQMVKTGSVDYYNKLLKETRDWIVNDTSQEPTWIDVEGFEYIRSWMGAPLVVRGKTIGILNVDSKHINVFTDEISGTVNAFASQAAIAIENARLFEAERQAHDRAVAFSQAAQAISSTLSLNQVIDIVLEQLENVLPFASGNVMFIEDGVARLQAGRGYEQYVDPVILESINVNIQNETVATLLKSNQPLMIPDTANDPRWEDTVIGGHIRSWLGIPLQIRDQIIGFFSIDRTTVGGFTGEEIAIGQAFAAHTSAAIENARLYEAQEEKASSLEALRDVGINLTATLEPKVVLDTVLDGVFHLVPGIHFAHIFYYTDEQLTSAASLHADGRRDAFLFHNTPNELTQLVAQSGEAQIINYLQNGKISTALSEEEWSGSVVGIPLKIGDRVIGVMNIAHQEDDAFSETDLQLLQLLADQAALVVENTRLFDDATKERSNLRLLFDIGQAVASSLSADDILNRTLSLACETMGASLGEACLYIPDEERLSLRSLYGKSVKYLEDLDEHINLQINVGLDGWVAKHRTPVYSPDVREDNRWLVLPGIDDDIVSVLVSPILEGTQLLGTLAVMDTKPDAFSSSQLDLLEAICQQAGLGLVNARRYQDVNRLVDMLAAEQYRMESLIENIPVGVMLLDQEHRLQVANPLGYQILGNLSSANEGDVITSLGPMSLNDLIMQHTAPMPTEITIGEEEVQTFEAEMRPLGDEDQQWVLMIRDITHEREVQEQVQLQDRLATVGQLAAGIAHDFNNIMAAIIVYADLLMMDPGLTPASRDRLNIIQQQVQRATSLIRQILDFSRRSVMEQIQLDLLPFFKELEKLLVRTLPETISINLDHDKDSYVISADPTQIQQVFMNLAVNARDAMPDGGSLRFEIKSLSIHPLDLPPIPDVTPGEWVRISVIDTGTGISPTQMPHIFEPFFTTKAAGQGTGLGLAQVYGIVKQHGGAIDLETEVGIGTSFQIYLPQIKEPHSTEPASKESIIIDGTGKSALVVEDDEATRDALETLLTAYNFQVRIAGNGKEAIKELELYGTNLSLVISDLVMPEMGGVELYHVIRERWPDMKILFITGHPLGVDTQMLLELGKVNWLQKPFSIQEFNDALKTLDESFLP